LDSEKHQRRAATTQKHVQLFAIARHRPILEYGPEITTKESEDEEHEDGDHEAKEKEAEEEDGPYPGKHSELHEQGNKHRRA
jgi:hypothetical protein